MSHRVHKLILFILVTCSSALAAEPAPTTWAKFYPYTAEKNDFHFELGGMQEARTSGIELEDGYYWLGLTYGRNLGSCFIFSSGHCAQYLDLNLGFANNYQATDEMGLLGLRWQFANSVQRLAPFVRVFAGAIDEYDQIRSGFVGTGGFGAGLSATVHPRFDVSLEARAGQADRFWLVTLVSFSVRLDRVVSSTMQVTGDFIKSTIDAPKTFVDWFNSSGSAIDSKKEK